MPRVAAIDCGTNSIRLLITDLTRDEATSAVRGVDVARRMEIVRLGAGVDATGRLDAAALQRTFAAVDSYAEMIRESGAERIRFVATSATRDAENAADFLTGVELRLGVVPEVVTGAEEAALSFAGATNALAETHPAPFGVVDIGGGSTEVVLGAPGAAAPGAAVPGVGTTGESGASGRSDDRGGSGASPAVTVAAALSVDVGCVRLTERHLRSDPPTPAEVAAARVDVDAALDRVEAEVPLARIRTLVGVAGTVTTLAAAALDLPRYDSSAIHASRHTVDGMLAVCDRVIRASRAERATWPFMHPGRVDVIGAGAVIWAAVVERVAERAGLAEVLVSEQDILDGIAASLLAR